MSLCNFIYSPASVCAHIASTSVINYQVMLMRKLIPGKRILNTEMVQILGHTSCQGWVRLSLGWRLSHKWKPALRKGKPCREKCTHMHAWVYKWRYPSCSHTCTSHFPPTCLDIPLRLSVSCRSPRFSCFHTDFPLNCWTFGLGTT